MKPLKKYYFNFEKGFTYTEEVKWVLNNFSIYIGLTSEFIYDSSDENAISIGSTESSKIHVNQDFFNLIYNEDYSIKRHLNYEMNVLNSDGTIDFISTAFYFLNCLWERSSDSPKDHWGRSEFTGSVWQVLGHNKPFLKVNQIFDSLADKIKIEVRKSPSVVFLSHDIDVVYGAYLEDGKHLVKQRKYLKAFKLGLEHIIKGPQWFNFRNIVDLEKKYAAISTFYWLPFKGKAQGIGKNADYDIHSKKIMDEISWLKAAGIQHGIHKSLTNVSLKKEIDSIPIEVESNRYHYLKFAFKDLQKEVNNTNLKMDSSLGYAEVIGYRNGYSLPFVPFNVEEHKPCTFIEVPLTIMDGTFSKYKNMEANEALKEIVNFLDAHKNNAVISVLWHNSHFTNFKYEGYPELYEKLLIYFGENNMQTVSPDWLIKKYYTNVYS